MSATCSLDGCDLPHRARSYCALHYKRWQRHGDPQQTTPPAPARHTRPCAAPACPRPHYGLGWCKRHYDRVQRNGTPELPQRTVDPVAVWRAVQGTPPDRLTVAEREQAITQLRRRQLNDQQIAARLRINPTSVLRIRHRLGLPAVTTPTH